MPYKGSPASRPRTVTVAALRALAAFAAVFPALLIAVPAQAHGALDSPVSRAIACSPLYPSNANNPACQAAIDAGEDAVMGAWDDIRVANVNGRDRSVIPDGRLCSAGLDAYQGLDLARADWPATTLTAGANFTFRYRSTIAHRGTFRLFLTRDGYQPTEPLRWSDLESSPFLTSTDPPLTAGAYVFTGKLPPNKTGRHLIYTIWQTSNTPDTYYSCSDVVFAGSVRSAASGSPGPSTTASAAASTAPSALSTEVPVDNTAAAPGSDRTTLLTAAVLGAPAIAGVIALVAYLRSRTRRT